MSAHIISVDSLSITARPEAGRLAAAPDYTSFDENEAQGLRAARGITLGVLLSLPAWLVLGSLCYLIF